MKPDSIVDIKAYKDYFLTISGGRTLSILSKKLEIIQEFEFPLSQLWNQEIHVEEKSSKALISVITTETFKLESKRYQGYNTFWFELNETLEGFEFNLIDKWERSDIKAIKSMIYNGERTWVALRELNYISQTGNKGKNSFIGVDQNTKLEVPKFEYLVSNQHSHLSQNFDIELNDKDIFISGIGSIAHDTPTILRIAKNRKNMEFIELDIPLKNLHNFHGTTLKKIGEALFAYFWITSSESCKKYTFELYSVRLENSLSDSTFLKAIESDYVHSFAWSSSGVAYKTDKGSTPCRIGEINETGKIIELEELEISHPKLLTESGELICTTDDRKNLIKIK